MVLAPTAAPPRTAAAARSVIRVFVAEDHHITLWGLSRLIDGAAPRLQLVGTARSRSELLNHDAAAQADVILLDLDLGGDDSVAVLSVLRQRCPGRVLVLTGAGDVAQHRDAVLQGARGVVHKSEPAETILRAIDKVHEGEVWLNRALLGQVLGQLTESEPAAAPRPADPEARRIASLTARERQIVAALVQGAGAKQFAIAQELGMSEHTLRNHLTTIYSKLGVRGRLEMHVYATTHGLGAAGRDAPGS
jgi:two-component system, NarL family, nitrate/nitrite response regulator NarL